ncbi:flagellar basal-body rod modification protein FlgD [Maridesulfovibrio ferrireducens]|uniref:Basal-body rod modification protein FlgD n=1 Tax=Maridesulfovibrio ferrireducens TaxID=246191 RepID=A0A1G9J764_9BACT|nr:flagellar hook assembly protein FlgD [Maridesulfovibrio ferrireducens]SDL33076.1 flagellar basal-body rod modification protein FlgD [Maridesulfovibrio ferrireducens]
MGYVGYSNILGRAEADMAASNTPQHKSSLGTDDFLKLLLTQMQNQDPANPMEDKEYMAQMAQFSSLEQLTKVNKNLESMSGNQAQEQMVSAVGFIGKEVKAEGYSLSRSDGKISKVFYGLGEPVANAFINIYDNDKNLIRTVQLGSKAEGTYEFEWDGKDWSGKDVSDGVYNIAMAAEDANGKPVMVKTEVSGEVTGVVSEGGQQFLHLKDGRYINFLNIREVVSPTVVAESPDGDSS